MKQHKLPWPYIAAAAKAMKKSEQEELSETMSFVGSLSFFPSHSLSLKVIDKRVQNVVKTSTIERENVSPSSPHCSDEY